MVSGAGFAYFLLVSCVCAMVYLGFVVLVYGVWGGFPLLGCVCLRDGLSCFRGACVRCLGLVFFIFCWFHVFA